MSDLFECFSNQFCAQCKNKRKLQQRVDELETEVAQKEFSNIQLEQQRDDALDEVDRLKAQIAKLQRGETCVTTH